MPKKTESGGESAFSDTPKSFEEAMERLEHVADLMQSHKLPLEDLITHYEEGLKLAKICGIKLDEAEKRIEMVTKRAKEAQGEALLKPFDEKNAKSPETSETSTATPDVSLF